MPAPAQSDLFDVVTPPKSRRRQAFADAILAGRSTREAVAAAGSKSTGHSADVLASRWLKKADVQSYLAVRRQLAVEAAAVDSVMVLREIGRIAFAQQAVFGGGLTVRVRDKLAALNVLATWLGLVGSDGQTVGGGAEARADVVRLDAALRDLPADEIERMAAAVQEALAQAQPAGAAPPAGSECEAVDSQDASGSAAQLTADNGHSRRLRCLAPSPAACCANGTGPSCRLTFSGALARDREPEFQRLEHTDDGGKLRVAVR
jgi:hypothetical protein